MRVAVIGGAGFIGSHLVQVLIRAKHKVLVYDNLASRRSSGDFSWLPKTEFVRADILNYRKLSGALRSFKPDFLYHLAAIHFIPYCEEHPAKIFRVNVEGTLHVMRAALDCSGVKGMVFASSSDIYSPGGRIHPESDRPAPIDVYGLSKELGERIVRLYCRRARISCIMARLFNVYGPGETNPHLIPQIVRQLRAGATELQVGRLDTYRDFIYVDDAVRALLRMATIAKSRTFQVETLNVGSGQECSMQLVVDTLCRLTRSSPRYVYTSRRTRKVDRDHLRCDTSRIREALSWKPRYDIVAGLRKLLEVEPL